MNTLSSKLVAKGIAICEQVEYTIGTHENAHVGKKEKSRMLDTVSASPQTLDAIRFRLGRISQKDLAELAEISSSTISRVEDGHAIRRDATHAIVYGLNLRRQQLIDAGELDPETIAEFTLEDIKWPRRS